jgi:2-(3-amino-3-carboxypropyl)histidine synthase
LYQLELDRVKEEVKRLGAKRILLQLPDGLRPIAYEIVEGVRDDRDTEVILSGDSCYGSCDIAIRQARELGADLLVHYGHSFMIKNDGPPVLYVHAEIDVDIPELVKAVETYLKPWRRVGLVSTVQHVHQLEDLAEALTRLGFEVHIGEGKGKTPLNGQVLGCYYHTAQVINKDVDAFLYVGGGLFHPIGLLLNMGKPVVVANPFSGAVTVMMLDDLMQLAKKRFAAITALRAATKVGVLVSSKPGQTALKVAEGLVRRFRSRNIKATIIYLDEVRADLLNNFVEAQAFIDTACPRIALDGVASLDKPIVTVREAEVALGDRLWEEIWGNKYLG